MKKYTGIIYIVIFIAVSMFAGIVGALSKTDVSNNRTGIEVQKILLSPQEKDGDYYFHLTLPDMEGKGSSFAFKTAHYECEVLIDGEVIYTLKNNNPRFSKSTGFRWNFIRLLPEDSGKELTLHVITVYKGQTPTGAFYLGNENDITQAICRENSPRFILAIFILVIGVVLFVYAHFVVEKEYSDDSLVRFSVFSILLAVWSIMESPITDLVKAYAVPKMVLDHYALMLMPIPFMLFICSGFSKKVELIWKMGMYFDAAVIVIRTVLQLLSVSDLKQTLWMTQLAIFVCIVLGSVAGIKEIRISKMTRQMRLNLICIFCIFATTVLELVLFMKFEKSSIVGMLGFVMYVAVMSVEMIKKSRRMLQRAQETEVYRKLAYTDELTGMYNRTAYQYDLDNSVVKADKNGKKDTVFMIDMNDLKKCNDNFGHENGDKYIKMVADAILKVFGIDARCYRIGGDEFCVIMPDATQNEIDNKLITLLRSFQELDRKGFVVPVSVAMGYASFSPEFDEKLEDTLKRADTLMYQNKELIKKTRAAQNA